MSGRFGSTHKPILWLFPIVKKLGKGKSQKTSGDLNLAHSKNRRLPGVVQDGLGAGISYDRLKLGKKAGQSLFANLFVGGKHSHFQLGPGDPFDARDEGKLGGGDKA